MIVQGKINDRRKTFPGEMSTVETLNTLQEATGLQVARALIDAKQDKVPVKIAKFHHSICETKQWTNSSYTTYSRRRSG